MKANVNMKKVCNVVLNELKILQDELRSSESQTISMKFERYTGRTYNEVPAIFRGMPHWQMFLDKGCNIRLTASQESAMKLPANMHTLTDKVHITKARINMIMAAESKLSLSFYKLITSALFTPSLVDGMSSVAYASMLGGYIILWGNMLNGDGVTEFKQEYAVEPVEPTENYSIEPVVTKLVPEADDSFFINHGTKSFSKTEPVKRVDDDDDTDNLM